MRTAYQFTGLRPSQIRREPPLRPRNAAATATTRREPLEQRKAELAKLLRKAKPGIRLSEHLTGSGQTITGIVSKRLSSPYRSGKAKCWITSHHKPIGAPYIEYEPRSQTITSKPLGEPSNVRPGAGRQLGGTRRQPAEVQAIWACAAGVRVFFRGAASAGSVTIARTAATARIVFIVETSLVVFVR